MTSTVDLKNTIPRGFELPPVVSTAKAILRKTKQEIPPESGNTFSYSTNATVKFNIGSNNAFLCGPECYLRGEMQVLAGETGVSPPHIFEMGGAHSLFRKVTISTLSQNVVLQQHDNYHRYSIMKKQLSEARHDVDEMGWITLDSNYPQKDPRYEVYNYDTIAMVTSVFKNAAGALGGIIYENATGIFYVGHLLQQGLIDIGDEVTVSINNGSSSTGIVYDLGGPAASADAVKIRLGGGNIALADVIHVRIKHRQNKNGPRQFTSKTPAALQYITKQFNIKLNMSFFDLEFPLFLMRGGIQISLELEDPRKLFQTLGNNFGLVANAASVVLTNLRFVCMFRSPHQEIIESFLNVWNSDSGIIYPLPSYTMRAINGNSGTSDNLSVLIGNRSIRRVNILQVDSAISEDAASEACDANMSLSTWLRANISSYQGQMGSHYFPLMKIDIEATSGVDDTTSKLNEAYKNVLATNRISRTRIREGEWYPVTPIMSAGAFPVNLVAALNRDSTKFIMSIDLSRDDGEFATLTGMDGTIIPFQLNLQRSANYQHASLKPYYYMFADIDQFLSLSSTGVNILN